MMHIYVAVLKTLSVFFCSRHMVMAIYGVMFSDTEFKYTLSVRQRAPLFH